MRSVTPTLGHGGILLRSAPVKVTARLLEAGIKMMIVTCLEGLIIALFLAFAER